MVSAVLGIAAVALLLTVGAPALSTFAVGAGHVALYRSRRDHLRGRTLALIGLGLGYLVPVVAIIEILVWGASLQR